MCGGSAPSRKNRHSRAGLSPRVRGKLPDSRAVKLPGRSIPACAGEAGAEAACRVLARVYPRVCGGSAIEAEAEAAYEGLSPRVRGKLGSGHRRFLRSGSIPACAGEARMRKPWAALIRVYPRVCGGSIPAVLLRHKRQGLSPRVRGKPGGRAGYCIGRRSIPACAGEARRRAWTGSPCRVYPRVCGGSAVNCPYRAWLSGLSPRVRGKPVASAIRETLIGSIPACAGEARWPIVELPVARVYPRVCGGSTDGKARLTWAEGLSPRVRGKPYRHCFHNPSARSIPACAGEALFG